MTPIIKCLSLFRGIVLFEVSHVLVSLLLLRFYKEGVFIYKRESLLIFAIKRINSIYIEDSK